jgi:hypothetical protein
VVDPSGSSRKLVALEYLKADLLAEQADLTRALITGPEDAVLEALGGMLATTYTLALTLGISLPRVEHRAQQRLESALSEHRGVDQWYGDIARIIRYLAAKPSHGRKGE